MYYMYVNTGLMDYWPSKSPFFFPDNLNLNVFFYSDCLYNVCFDLKVPYHEKHVFYGVYICKLVLPEPTNSTNEESKQVLHHLCSPPTGKTAL